MKSILFVPLVKDGEAVGALAVSHAETGLFSEKHVALLKTFADQAVIAIENVRLFNETKRLLSETEQRAAELAIINSVQQGLASKLDYQAILDLVGDKIREIFDAQGVAIGTYDHAARLVHYGYMVQKGRRVPAEPAPFAGMSLHMIKTRRTLVINENFERRIEEIGSTWIAGMDKASLRRVRTAAGRRNGDGRDHDPES